MRGRIRPAQLLGWYFSSYWMPAALCFLVLGALALAAVPFPDAVPGWVLSVLLVGVLISLAGILAAVVTNLYRKRWTRAAVNFVLLGMGAVATFAVLLLIMLSSMFGPSEDGFADHLTIPADVEVAEPAEELHAATGGPGDAFQQAMLTALATPGNEDPAITANVTSLATLERNAPGILRRHLAANPSWRVFQERGHVFATRRWMIESEWEYTLHGYYTHSDINRRPGPEVPKFQSRFTIGLSGTPWVTRSGDVTSLAAGETKTVSLSSGNGMDESHCVIKVGSLVAELFEQSEAKERRLTKAALVQLEQELAPIAARPDWATVRENLPPGSIRRGQASLGLRNSFQPGIYESVIWANPGEPGMIYLKAFEVTKGTPLSVDSLKEYSNECMGWSDDPEELFLSNTHFTIYEGDWDKPYAARFELWFAPDSGAGARAGAGAGERKLMEKVFKIEGWQR